MPNPDSSTPVLDITDGSLVAARGNWQVHALTRPGVIQAIQAKLKGLSRQSAALRWDLSQVGTLDHIGAQLLWNAWGKQRPQQLTVAPQHRDFFQRLADAGPLQLPPKPPRRRLFNAIYDMGSGTLGHVAGFITLLGQLVLDFLRMLQVPQRAPWKEISANIYHVGYQALGITALVGFLIGVVLSFLSAQQLHTFGGDIYLVNILGMSIIRELGPLLAAILVAGRSGSAITAQLGVMRVTEELDAMLVMGLPHGFRLILPRVLALLVAMPLLVIWTDAIALLGGMTAAQLQLGLSPTYFLQQLPNAVPLPNYLIGLGKGAVFGGLIAMVACYFGLRIEPNTESLGHGTTTSVVTAITIVIVADAIFAIIFSGVGF
ncbi:phospholipid/cholesterol/gamma-HCH transport system permease protein [Collimonas sp. PA-H2]|uniref:MlaE family ABC transporter permease n=1 Tax=Collimonas sp. PA-H2 TaxID=1881062 RepID=UPI000BF6145F|nr:ABC transporter permease [Collimonas sp. PA-H2]PFH09495.1 phospholipid/cholesterol/gamma-HCH transport system permease protein [Collimonas sp. PA-H2]